MRRLAVAVAASLALWALQGAWAALVGPAGWNQPALLVATVPYAAVLLRAPGERFDFTRSRALVPAIAATATYALVAAVLTVLFLGGAHGGLAAFGAAVSWVLLVWLGYGYGVLALVTGLVAGLALTRRRRAEQPSSAASGRI